MYANTHPISNSGPIGITNTFANDDKNIEMVIRNITHTSPIESCYFDHYNTLVGLARTLVDDIDSAQEVVQHVFAKITTNNPTFNNDDALNYVRIAVVNECRSTLRKRKTQRKHLSIVSEKQFENVTDVNMTSKENLAGSSIVLQAALKELPRRQRECIALSYLEELTHAEIAKALEISIGSVKQHITRALVALQKNLKEKS